VSKCLDRLGYIFGDIFGACGHAASRSLHRGIATRVRAPISWCAVGCNAGRAIAERRSVTGTCQLTVAEPPGSSFAVNYRLAVRANRPPS